MPKNTIKELAELKIVFKLQRIHPNHFCDNYAVIASIEGENGLERKAREVFTDIDIPNYIYIPEKHELKVGNDIVHYALVCGVYGK